MNHADLGVQAYLNNDFPRAKDLFLQHLAINPNDLTVLHNVGITCVNMGQLDEALDYFKRPIEAGAANSLLSAGVAYREKGQYHEALVHFAKSIAADSQYAAAYSNYGNTLREFNQPDLAIPFLQLAQKFNPDMVIAKLNESIAHLMMGNLTEGWKNYEYRWYYESENASFKPQLPFVEWDGTQDLSDKTILVYNEQGFGDSIQFCRYLFMIQKLAKKVIYATRPELSEFFISNFPDILVIDGSNIPTPFDYHVPLLDLPKCFNTTIDTIPAQRQYLSASKKDTAKWKRTLGKKTKKRVGIVWDSNKVAYTSRFRKIPLETLSYIFSDEHEFISLSVDSTEEEIKFLRNNNVKTFDEKLKSTFANTAGLVANLDLVITVDTAMAHLAGAMGIPTWVLLPNYACDWRWFMNRSDSPFYPTVRLFRQPSINEWSSVVVRIKSELDRW